MACRPGRTRKILLALGLLASLPAQATSACEGCGATDIPRLDREITQAYQAAAMLMDANGRARLRGDQQVFEAVRKSATATGDFDLGAQMLLRRDFLRAIREARGKWIGHWANATGTLAISRGADGKLAVRASAAEPAVGHWICEFDEAATLAGTTMIVGADSARLDHGGPNEGWTLTLKLVGDVLTLEEVAPRGIKGQPPFCNRGGTLSGTYFAQAQETDAKVSATAR